MFLLLSSIVDNQNKVIPIWEEESDDQQSEECKEDQKIHKSLKMFQEAQKKVELRRKS